MKDAKERKKVVIPLLIEELKTEKTKAKILNFSKYNELKRFVSKDIGAGNLVDNGHHFLDIMTKALASVKDPKLGAKWEELRTENAAKREKRQAKFKVVL